MLLQYSRGKDEKLADVRIYSDSEHSVSYIHPSPEQRAVLKGENPLTAVLVSATYDNFDGRKYQHLSKMYYAKRHNYQVGIFLFVWFKLDV